jgi:hypothetical protein
MPLSMSSVFSPSEAAEQAQHNHLREKIDWYRSQMPPPLQRDRTEPAR